MTLGVERHAVGECPIAKLRDGLPRSERTVGFELEAAGPPRIGLVDVDMAPGRIDVGFVGEADAVGDDACAPGVDQHDEAIHDAALEAEIARKTPRADRDPGASLRVDPDIVHGAGQLHAIDFRCLLYTSDAADE
mgnify:CR=1 FL=1